MWKFCYRVYYQIIPEIVKNEGFSLPNNGTAIHIRAEIKVFTAVFLSYHIRQIDSYMKNLKIVNKNKDHNQDTTEMKP